MAKRILFVCMGNICRSPTAEGVMRRFIQIAGLEHLITVDSAGTNGYHLGSPPDGRAIAAAARRRYDLNSHRARKVEPSDFTDFDRVLAMDTTNLTYLTNKCPPTLRGKLGLLMDFAPAASYREVPDPYYGGQEGFELVLDLVEEGAEGLLDQLRQELGH